jgi:murein L,D-transpeptidase YafK
VPEAVVLVDTGRHSMALCRAGRREDAFRVRLGKHGTGKTREGDGKTPLGRYGLGAPRHSVAFGLFAPIEYPTPAQRAQGFTGTAVGVHGPHRSVRSLGAWTNALDTTDGCVGLATDAEMLRFQSWVVERRAHTIIIE